MFILAFVLFPPSVYKFPRVMSFEAETVPTLRVNVFVIILVVVSPKSTLPEVTVSDPTVKLEPDGVSLPPFVKVSTLLEKLFITVTGLCIILTSILLVKLPDTVILLGVSIVRSPVIKSLPAKSMEVKLELERIKLGVALEVIEPVSVKFPTIVRYSPAVLSQFTLLPDIKDRPDIVEVKKDIGALPVLVTYTFGLLVIPRSAVIFPIPSPAK